MRKIDKDLSDTNIPNTLTKGNTKSKRLGVIANGYPTKSKSSDERAIKKANKKVKEYDKHFKEKDILDSLDDIYNSKCAYCEEKIYRVNADNLTDNSEKKHSIDHYRPKSKYPWLAFSWDNLLWCCDICNQNKDNKFKIDNTVVNYDKTFIGKIHNSTEDYNKIEEPKLIHPELEDISDELTFDKNGRINSTNRRVQCTIATCKLNRPYLKGERKKIWVEFKNKIDDSIAQNNKVLIDKVIKEFKEDSENMNNEFIAFRIWVLSMF